MGVEKQITKHGNGIDRPQAGDVIAMEYRGYLYDSAKIHKGYRGKKFDSSSRYGRFELRIGVGEVIKGWDRGIVDLNGGMTLGEKATLTITSDYAYGKLGFPKYVPPDTGVIFDVELIAINGKTV